MSTEIHVPTLGESITEATVGAWLKTAGEQVEVDEILCELETDKVAVEVPAPVAGTIGEIVANAGETVEVGALLAVLTEGAGSAGPAPKGGPSSTGRQSSDQDQAGAEAVAPAPE
ncbi:MAG: dihydrolipoamide succinyltransferase, partial [Rhodobacteraceae bacterium]|nr:dihydrolipoamide succinyltransferase [Paracoccaceae bacterium]